MDLSWLFLVAVPVVIYGVAFVSVLWDGYVLRRAARRPVTVTPPAPAQLTKGERHKEQQRLWDVAFEATERLTKL